MRPIVTIAVILIAVSPGFGQAPPEMPKALETPLPGSILNLLADEISGQMAYNNLVRLAGAPWLRDPAEFTTTLYEAAEIHRLARGHGIETTRLERYPGSGKFDYPREAELWAWEPERKLLARLAADPALIARGSQSAEVQGELVYIPPLDEPARKKMLEPEAQGRYRGKLALMWSHAGGEIAQALDAADIQAVISFNARERYLDPGQVVYSSGAYNTGEHLKLGMTVSWRQWSELLEDLQAGKKIVMKARAVIEQHDDKFETVYSWIPGTEPERKGVVLTAHLFEGYTKRGANDNMSGCVVQLEILRALSKLIAAGHLPRPRRTIHFIWPNEISGTYEFIKQHPGFPDSLSININMDMVGEGLRKNNSLFTMSESPGHLPSYLDGLARSVMNYVWRTNDIVYLPDAPRGRPGGQYFPRPLWEKNGSLDAFRFFIHRATGGSDHICFNNPSVAVPGIEFFTWPDQWYHADTDTPDKADPTQLKRVAFIGAACAWAAADCTDEMLPRLLDAVSAHGLARMAEREIPSALNRLARSGADRLAADLAAALNLVDFGARREIRALQSVREIATGSPASSAAIDGRIGQWEAYRGALRSMVLESGRARAQQLGVPFREPSAGAERTKYQAVIPAIAPAVRGKEFNLSRNPDYARYMKEHPDAWKELGLTAQQAQAVLNYVNGRRSIAEIRDDVAAETDEDVGLAAVAAYLALLKEFGWVTY